MTKPHTIIIGGGIGGLFTGAFLAHNGVRVTVLEKNAIIGGGLQCFSRHGKIFETGMHVMGGFEPGGNLHKICHYLGILPSLQIHHIDPGCMDSIHYSRPGHTYRIASGRQGFVNSLTAHFPHEADGLKAYVDALYALTDEVPLYSLRPELPGMIAQPHSEFFTMPADEFIARFVTDPRLRELLAYLNPLYSGVTGHTPAYVHALINVLYINGASRFIGGSQQLADALRGVIESQGGEVLAPCQVTAIDVHCRQITALHTADGRTFSADRYVSSIHPTLLTAMLPEGALPKAFVNRLHEIPDSCSAFSLFIDLKPGRFPYIDHTCYFMEDYGSIWEGSRPGPHGWPEGFMYMTPPDPAQGAWASRLLVHCIMDFDRVSRWQHTTVGRRGPEYLEWKRRHADNIIAKLERLHPGLTDAIAAVHSSSPLTVRDYYGTRNGAIFGYRKDCRNLMLSQLPVYTKISNLLLTGQNINLHGICGVPLTAITTAEAILGAGVLTREINRAYERIS